MGIQWVYLFLTLQQNVDRLIDFVIERKVDYIIFVERNYCYSDMLFVPPDKLYLWD